jgi:hypothetical protein
MTALGLTVSKDVFLHLLSRWGEAAAPLNQRPLASAQEAVVEARLLLSGSLDHFRPFMSAADAELYARLISAGEPRELGALYFACFDLLARNRGMAVAVVGMQELYRLLRPFTEPNTLPGAAQVACKPD